MSNIKIIFIGLLLWILYYIIKITPVKVGKLILIILIIIAIGIIIIKKLKETYS